MNDPGRPRGFHLLDLSAIVVGYAMASLLVRAFWPSGEMPSLAEIAAIGLVYLWLGLAMSGPLVLLVGRSRRSGSAAAGTEAARRERPVPGPRVRARVHVHSHTPSDRPQDKESGAGARTWAELAWLIIGFYWIGLAVLVVPVRLRRSPLHDAAIFGLLPIVAALVLRFLHHPGPTARPVAEAPAWTHRAAVGLLLAWPIAWIALIVLGKSLL